MGNHSRDDWVRVIVKYDLRVVGRLWVQLNLMVLVEGGIFSLIIWNISVLIGRKTLHTESELFTFSYLKYCFYYCKFYFALKIVPFTLEQNCGLF